MSDTRWSDYLRDRTATSGAWARAAAFDVVPGYRIEMHASARDVGAKLVRMSDGACFGWIRTVPCGWEVVGLAETMTYEAALARLLAVHGLGPVQPDPVATGWGPPR